MNSATRSTPSRSRLTSRRARATMMSTIAACSIGSRRPTAPKSMSPSSPPARTNTLPGCGSAWNTPIRMIWSRVARSSSSASRCRSTSASSKRPMSETVTPSKRSWTRTRLVDRSRYTAGTRTVERSPSRAAISLIASASWRKSTSLRRPVANWASRSPERTPWPNGVRRWAMLASSVRAARSRSIIASMSGRCTLTTTDSPERNRAR